jgi:hypothetical protein
MHCTSLVITVLYDKQGHNEYFNHGSIDIDNCQSNDDGHALNNQAMGASMTVEAHEARKNAFIDGGGS